MNYFFYDGNCPFCSRMAMRLKMICLSKDIEFFSFRNFPKDKLLGINSTLTEEVLTANVQFVYNGFRYPGFFAIRKIVPHLKFYKYFFWVLYLPFIPIIGMLLMNYLKQRTGHESKG